LAAIGDFRRNPAGWQTQLRRIEHVNGAGQARFKVLDAVPVTFGAMSHYQKHDRLARALFLSLFV